jgi:hypothetical protein
MRLWEETWVHVRDEVDGDMVRLGEQTLMVDDGPSAALIAAAPNLVRALLEVEWVEYEGPGSAICPACKLGRVDWAADAHAPGCELDAALRKAGAR